MFLKNTIFDTLWIFLKEKLSDLIVSCILILIAVILIIISKAITKRYIKKEQNKRKRVVTLINLINVLIKYLIITILVISILSVWGVNVTSILVGAGILTLAITFGAQKFIADILSGISLVFENYFDIDDVVEIGGFKGRVFEIGLKSTKIINWKNEIKIIANSEIVNVVNYSRAPSVGVVEVKVDYSSNIDQVLELLEEKLLNLKEQYEEIVEGPNVLGVVGFSDNGYIIRITVKTLTEQHYAVERGIRKYIKEVFEESDFSIPLPKIVVIKDESNN